MNASGRAAEPPPRQKHGRFRAHAAELGNHTEYAQVLCRIFLRESAAFAVVLAEIGDGPGVESDPRAGGEPMKENAEHEWALVKRFVVALDRI